MSLYRRVAVVEMGVGVGAFTILQRIVRRAGDKHPGGRAVAVVGAGADAFKIDVTVGFGIEADNRSQPHASVLLDVVDDGTNIVDTCGGHQFAPMVANVCPDGHVGGIASLPALRATTAVTVEAGHEWRALLDSAFWDQRGYRPLERCGCRQAKRRVGQRAKEPAQKDRYRNQESKEDSEQQTFGSLVLRVAWGG